VIKDLEFDLCGFKAKQVVEQLLRSLVLDSTEVIADSCQLAKYYADYFQTSSILL
jgi:hypothetical protein